MKKIFVSILTILMLINSLFIVYADNNFQAIIEIERLNFNNPIKFTEISDSTYKVEVFDALYQYGEVRLGVESETDNEVAISQVIDKNEEVIIKLNNKTYYCEIVVKNDDGYTINFLGRITLDKEYINLHFNEGYYDNNPTYTNDAISMAAAGTIYETEPNDTPETAVKIFNDYDVYGTMTNNKVDFYKIKFAINGKANFWLGNIPVGKNHDIYVYEGTSKLLGSNTTSSLTQKLLQFDVKKDIDYYIKIVYTGTEAITGQNYLLRVKNYEYVSYVTENKKVSYCFHCKKYTTHRGIDILPKVYNTAGDSVYSMLSGTVIDAFWEKSSGNVISIRHLKNPALVDNTDSYLNTRYMHLKNDSTLVRAGNSVELGQKIASMGNTGTNPDNPDVAYGVHLHYEVGTHNNTNSARFDGTLINPIKNFFPDLVCNACSNTSANLLSEESYSYKDNDNRAGIFINDTFVSLDYLENLTNDEIIRLGITSDDLYNLMLKLDDIKRYEEHDRLLNIWRNYE